MNYKEAVDYMENAQTFGCVLELENTTELLRLMGNPQIGLSIIHIAGTNGKGSVASYIAHVLAAADYKVGRYLSPAVFDFRERITFTEKREERIESSYISREAVAEHVGKIRLGAEDMVSRGMYHPTCFELQTVLAFMEFKRAECDFVILEVGLGGRYDSTNIIRNPLCSVITSISFDHCAVLGDTIDKIAYEKAGIIKDGVPVVVYDQEVQPELSLPVIKQAADEKEAEFIRVDFNNIKNPVYSLKETVFDFEEFKRVKIRILGENQVKNAALALKVIQTLRRDGLNRTVKIEIKDIYEGMKKAKWGGRFEIIGREPLMIIDGAHNADAAKALSRSIKLYLSKRPLIFLMGVFKDKDYEGILENTASLAEHIITVTANTDRALSGSDLANAAKKYTEAAIHEADSILKGVCLAKKLCPQNGAVVVFGSLSFLGDVYLFQRGIGRGELILKNELFEEKIREIKDIEKDRVYCKHGLEHLLCVARIAELLAMEEGRGDKKEMIYAASLLHDIGRADEYKKGVSHERAGGLLAEIILSECFFNKEEKEKIKEVVENHKKEGGENYLQELIHKADRLSRNCFSCEVRDSCKWEEEEKNKTVIW